MGKLNVKRTGSQFCVCVCVCVLFSLCCFYTPKTMLLMCLARGGQAFAIQSFCFWVSLSHCPFSAPSFSAYFIRLNDLTIYI